jgi:hypothetical protein
MDIAQPADREKGMEATRATLDAHVGGSATMEGSTPASRPKWWLLIGMDSSKTRRVSDAVLTLGVPSWAEGVTRHDDSGDDPLQ